LIYTQKYRHEKIVDYVIAKKQKNKTNNAINCFTENQLKILPKITQQEYDKTKQAAIKNSSEITMK